MSDAAPPSPIQRLQARGLDPAALAATGLEGTGAPPPPPVPGYEIESLLGTGGLGHVWKAVRCGDGVTVALKIPHTADPAFAERLHAEAESLRALDHPHILRSLSHGTLPGGHPWLALEYVDGAPLSVLIPPGGFAWPEALAHFRRIAGAVIHAHEKAVLHRDLKPSNILIGHDGSLKVADFGLARPLAERVVTFSLTLSGHVAGTAEYLAPECYAREYRPAAAADIYALGVILYELLAGHPPRGAWQPVSQEKQVDIRVDDVLRRAMEPNPAKRFPSVQAMLGELEVISRTPPRYSGTPRLTRPVRFMDFVWTIIGLFLFLGTLGLVNRIEKYDFGLPIDLIGTNTIRIGTYQAILLLLLCALPFGLWQLFRLWHFRRVPLREALPAPFGLKLGTTRTAGVIVLLSQFLFLIAPGVLGAYAWRERCMDWLDATSAPWNQGLVVSEGYRGLVAHDPWAWPEQGKSYYLRERSGWITDPRSVQHDMTRYYPGIIPRLLTGLALFCAAVVIITVLSAFARWWRFRKWGRSVVLLALLGWAHRTVQAEHRSREAMRRRETAAFAVDSFYVDSHARLAGTVLRTMTASGSGGPPFLLEEHLYHFADTVRCGGAAPATGAARRAALARYAAPFYHPHRTLEGIRHDHSSMPGENRFATFLLFHDFTDPPGAPATCALMIQVAYGAIIPPHRVAVDRIAHHSVPLWTADPLPLSPEEATTWATALLTTLRDWTIPLPTPSGPDTIKVRIVGGTAGQLESLFHPHILNHSYGHHWDPDPQITPVPGAELIAALRTACDHGARPTLARPPSPAQELPGGRRRIVLEIEDRGQPATWTADLIHTAGRWQYVKLSF